MAASISGLASGLDTATIIGQLMELEAAPKVRLQSKVKAETSVITNLQLVNSRFSTITTKAQELISSSVWGKMSATSSSSDVAATAASTTQTGSYSFAVNSVATGQKTAYATSVTALTDPVVTPGGTLSITLPSGAVNVSAGDGTLQGLIAAINTSGAAVQAAAVKDDNGYRLLVTSKNTGTSSAFSLTIDGASFLGGATTTAATNAQLDLGAGLVVTSASNSFQNLVPGLSLTLSPNATVGSKVKVDVATDAASAQKAASSLVDAINSALNEIKTSTAYNASSKTSGILAGEASLRGAVSDVFNAILPAGGQSLAQYGIELTRNGTVTFDSTKFAAAYSSDPTGVQTALGTGGLATRVKAAADKYSNSSTGILATSIAGHNQRVKDLNTSISSWDLRLKLKETALTRQFTSLETSLNQMNARSTWLAGQISSLPSIER